MALSRHARLVATRSPEIAAVVRRWLRDPVAGRAAVRAARRLDHRAANGAVPTADELAATARAMVELGRSDLGARLLDHALRLDGGQDPALVRARRAIRSRPVPVPEPLLLEAARHALASDARVAPLRISGEPLPGGKNRYVDGVVRHRVDRRHTMVRKSLWAARPREVTVHRSGVLSGGGTWWRPPNIHLVAEEGPHRWHVFMEDLGEFARAEGAALVRIARALGEVAGGTGTSQLMQSHPWLEDPIGAPLPLTRSGWVSDPFRDELDPHLAQRVNHTLQALGRHEAALLQRAAELPRGLSHGDCHSGNAYDDWPRRVVLLDWATCALRWVGTDLGVLLAVPNRTVLRDPGIVGRCLEAYAEGCASAGGLTASLPEIELGYRLRVVAHSLHWQMDRRPTPRPDHRHQRVADDVRLALLGQRRAIVSANFRRICDEADALLGLV